MVDLSYKDYRDEQASGNPSILGELADTAVNAVCSIYRKSPANWLSNNAPGTPILDAQRAFYDNLCRDTGPLPSLPKSPFTGGQCCGVPYTVTVQGRIDVSNGQQLFFTNSVGFTGKLASVSAFREGAGANAVTGIRAFTLEGIACDTPRQYDVLATQVENLDGTTSSYAVVNVTVNRDDNQPDNCGSLPPVYPPPSGTAPDFTFNTNFNISPTISVPVTVSVVPVVNVGVAIIKPEVNVDVGGIRVNASLGGFTFSPTIALPPGAVSPKVDPRTPPPPSIPPGTSSDSVDYSDTLVDILDKLDNLEDEVKECCDSLNPFGMPTQSKTRTTTLTTAKSGTLALPAKTYKVSLEIIERPAQEKVQFGEDGANVIYAGWAWFGDPTGQSDRKPVDADFKVFDPPARITSKFSFTLYTGYRAIIRAHYIE